MVKVGQFRLLRLIPDLCSETLFISSEFSQKQDPGQAPSYRSFQPVSGVD